MQVLVPDFWVPMLEAEAVRRGISVTWVPYAEGRTGPFPGVEVFLRPEGSRQWQEAFAAAPDVRYFHTTSAGVDGILPLVAPRGITLTESGTVYRIAMGEFALALMLFAAKRLGEHYENFQAGRWQPLVHGELAGQTCGIIGLGPVGLGVAERAAAMGMRVIGCRRNGQPAERVADVVPPAGLGRLLRESDYVVLACPLTPETRRLVGAEALAQMKPSAVLINIARGGLVDTHALAAALKAGRIGGACLDVTDPEPLPPNHALRHLPNVFLTPHIAPGDAKPLLRRKLELFLENLARYLRGEPLLNLVDPARGY